ncbi:type II toxin-antitoxin system toxin TscT, partial [Staphylococcus aureus]
LNKDDVIKEGFSYHERRIHNDQMFDLLLLYTEKFDELITRFDALEKASSFADQSQDNA